MRAICAPSVPRPFASRSRSGSPYVVQGSVQYDRRPAETVERADWKTRTGISVRL